MAAHQATDRPGGSPATGSLGYSRSSTPANVGFAPFAEDVTHSDALAVLHAAEEGEIELLTELILEGHDVNAQDEQGWTALHWCAFLGDDAVTLLLLQCPWLSCDAPDQEGKTPLLLACEAGHSSVIQLLLCSSRVNAWARSDAGETALELAERGLADQSTLWVLQAAQEFCASPHASGDARLPRNVSANVARALPFTNEVPRDPVVVEPDLYQAIVTGSLPHVVDRLTNEPSLFLAKDALGRTALHYAAEENEHSVAAFLLEDPRCDPNAQDAHGRTALHLACMYHHEESVAKLLSFPSVEVNGRMRFGWTPMHVACIHGQVSVLLALLRAAEDRLDLCAVDEQGWTALHWAVYLGHTRLVQVMTMRPSLLPALSVQDHRGRNPTDVARLNRKAGAKSLLRLLSRGETSADIGSATGRRAVAVSEEEGAMWDAVRDDNVAELERLCAAHPSLLESQDARDRTPLHYALRRGSAASIAFFLERTPVHVINRTDCSMSTALHEASRSASASVRTVGRLLRAGADPWRVSYRMRLPLHDACAAGHLTIAQTLWDAMASPPTAASEEAVRLDSLRAHLQWTPLHAAVVGRSAAVVEWLLSIGASPYSRSVRMWTALHWASQRPGAEAAMEVLLRHVGPAGETMLLEVQDKMGQSPLLVACRSGNAGAIAFLLEAGADASAADADGRTCVTWLSDNEDKQGLQAFVTHCLGDPPLPAVTGDRDEARRAWQRWTEVRACDTIIDALRVYSLDPEAGIEALRKMR